MAYFCYAQKKKAPVFERKDPVFKARFFDQVFNSVITKETFRQFIHEKCPDNMPLFEMRVLI